MTMSTSDLVEQMNALIFHGESGDFPSSVNTTLRLAASRLSELEEERGRLLERIAKLETPEFYYDDEDPECGGSCISDVIADMDTGDVMRVGGSLQVWCKWVAYKCLAVDVDGEPDETTYQTFETFDEAEKCWPESLAAARAKLKALGPSDA